MSHYHLHLAFLCLLITVVLQACAHSIPPQLVAAARLVQVILGVVFIYFMASVLVGNGAV